MNKIHQKRILYVSLFCASLSIAVGLILYALKQNINAFVTPTELSSLQVATDYHLRLGGMVKKNSVLHDKESLAVHFVVTDFKHDVTVNYIGVLPDLFREGKGVIVEGSFANGQFAASTVLAKHDENYMPKKVWQNMGDKNKDTEKIIP